MTHEVLYLKADTRDALIAALEAAGMWKDGFVKRYQGDELFERGQFYEPTGKMIDTPMGQVPETAPVPGYHADMTLFGDVPAALTAIRIFPDDPKFQPGGWESPKALREKAAAIAAAEASMIEK